MTVSIVQWEQQLLSLAQEALESYAPREHEQALDRQALEKAYQYCAEITYINSRTFYMASGLLPEAKKHSARALYAFCRVSDNLVDCSQGDDHSALEAWRAITNLPTPGRENLVALAWDDTRHKYRIPWRYAEQLINGVARDFNQKCYETFDDLATYCYGVACTVGLMSMHIVGYAGEEAIPYAIRLGVALQLTNILRDVGDDLHTGRIYLPTQELEAFGLQREDLERGIVTESWREFMRFQIDRNRKLYDEAMPGIHLLDRDGRFGIAAAAELYQGILGQIEKNDYDVFQRRAALSKSRKLSMLPGIWWRANRGGYRARGDRLENALDNSTI